MSSFRELHKISMTHYYTAGIRRRLKIFMVYYLRDNDPEHWKIVLNVLIRNDHLQNKCKYLEMRYSLKIVFNALETVNDLKWEKI